MLASVPPTQSLSMGGVTFNDLGGTIEVVLGNLDIGEGVSQGGTYTVAAGSDLELANGNNRTISGTFTGSGGGTVSILTLDHSLYLADSGATFDFPAGMLQLVGGSITVVTAGANPVLLNSGFMTVSAGGEFNWNAGTLQNVGTLTVALTGPSAAFNINNPAVVDNTGTIDLEGDVSLGGDGTLNNSGTLIAATLGDRIRSTQLQPPEQHRHDRRQVRHTQFQRFDRHAVERREQRRVGRSDRGDMEVEGTGTLTILRTDRTLTQNTGGTVILNGPNAAFHRSPPWPATAGASRWKGARRSQRLGACPAAGRSPSVRGARSP